MRSPLTLFALLSLPSLLACGGKSASAPPGNAQCPDSQTTCLTAPSCAWDGARQCNFCHCSPAMPAPGDNVPQGPPVR